jgi:hypothetical protein
LPWLPESQKLSWALSVQADAFIDRGQLCLP